MRRCSSGAVFVSSRRGAHDLSDEPENLFVSGEFAGIRGGLTANQTSKPESQKTSANAVEVEGKIVAVLPGTMFRVQLANGHIVLGHISGKLRKHFIKIAAGDTVKMEMSPYDLEKARITFRVKDSSSTYRPPMRRRH
jgi:translation initiation factor IF-1